MSRNIVCLDGYTLNPGDIDWKPLEALGTLIVHDRTDFDVERIVERAAGATYVLTNKTPLGAQTLARLPELKYVGVLATGYDVVDTVAAKARGIVVTNVPTYGSDSVAQHAAALMLELARRVGDHAQAVRQGQWTRCPDFCFTVAPIMELTGRTLGVVGMGRIGRQLAKIGAAMGMRLIGNDAFKPEAAALEGLKIQWVELDELFRQADVISLHCPLTDENYHMVDARRLRMMKRSAILINTSRGPLVDSAALAEALTCGGIGGAGLDVLEVEPPRIDDPLLGAPNCVVTPHVAWASREARQRLMGIAAENLRAFQNGKPVNLVN